MMQSYYRIVDDIVEEIHTINVYEFSMGDVEDPDLWAAEPLYKWEKSESGKWIMEHAIEPPVWQRQLDITQMGYRYCVTAKLRSKDLTYFLLKWNNRNV